MNICINDNKISQIDEIIIKKEINKRVYTYNVPLQNFLDKDTMSVVIDYLSESKKEWKLKFNLVLGQINKIYYITVKKKLRDDLIYMINNDLIHIAVNRYIIYGRVPSGRGYILSKTRPIGKIHNFNKFVKNGISEYDLQLKL